ncbi:MULTISPECIES: hypothetical protein [unclassified Sinorhizobium]|uniref:hypothetical protein n=1 Tax=unclassified Sinorhizobium TaxID=2613772 RepID=UPI003523B796
MAAPLDFVWNGEAFEPSSRFIARKCDQAFTVGEHYTLVEHHDRSMSSHRHFFASVNEAWKNLPEDYSGLPFAESPEHLRAYALIKTGWCDTHTIVASSKAEALRIAAYVRPIGDFSVVDVRECTVTRYTAKSQSLKAMGAKDFQQSKSDVLEFLDDLIGTERGTLAAQGRAA